MNQISNKKITASAPGKLMLAGSYSVVHGRPCLVTAVDQRLFVTVEKTTDDNFYLDAPDLGLKSYSKKISELGEGDLPKAVRFIEIIYKIFLREHPQKNGVKVETRNEFSSKFGFGSSSAATTAFAKAITTLYKVRLDKKALFNLCYQAVIEVQGVGSGFDLAAAIWGGTIYYISPALVVEPLELEKLPIVVGYTGVKANTPTLVKKINAKLEKDPATFEKNFDMNAEVVEGMKKALQEKNWEEVGSYLNQHQVLMRQLGVSSPELESLITKSLQAGAKGAGLSGAGGGDCMLSVINVDGKNKQAVEKAIDGAGGEVLPVKLNAPGAKIEN